MQTANDAPIQPLLNLPDYPVRVSCTDGKHKIWDVLRKKYVSLTPEEYVRQRVVMWLANDLHYPVAMMNNEITLQVASHTRRCDTLVFDRIGSPFMVIEYKAPNVKVNQEVFDQIARYNMVLGAKYLVVTNGLEHYCCALDYAADTYHFIPIIPDWQAAMHGPIEN